MQAKKRLPDVSVIQGLMDEPQRFHFIQAMRILVRWLRQAGLSYDDIAVDTSIIPARAKVDIEGVGTRYADDKGSAIQTYHIDNFLGAGAAVVKAWMLGGVNGTRRQVKYLGAE